MEEKEPALEDRESWPKTWEKAQEGKKDISITADLQCSHPLGYMGDKIAQHPWHLSVCLGQVEQTIN